MFSVVHVLTDPTELTKLVDERGSTRAKDVSWEGDGFQEGSSTSRCKSRSSLNVLKEIDEKRNLCSAALFIKHPLNTLYKTHPVHLITSSQASELR